MIQDKVTFYKRWMEATKDLPEEARLSVYDAIMQYAFEGTAREFGSQLAQVTFNFIKQDIDADGRRAAEISAKRKLAGRQGGAPKKNSNARRGEKGAVSPIPAPVIQDNLFPDVQPVEPPKKPAKPPKPQKHKYAPDVLLTEAEYQNLADRYGTEGAEWMITKLDNYKAARGTTYKSDYRAILNWVVKEYEKQQRNETTSNTRNGNAAHVDKQWRDTEFANYIADKLSGE